MLDWSQCPVVERFLVSLWCESGQVLAEEPAPLEVAWTATVPSVVTDRGSKPDGSSSAVSADRSLVPQGADAQVDPTFFRVHHHPLWHLSFV
jgi:hypothetical protein